MWALKGRNREVNFHFTAGEEKLIALHMALEKFALLTSGLVIKLALYAEINYLWSRHPASRGGPLPPFLDVALN
jgi:hypothetical protein